MSYAISISNVLLVIISYLEKRCEIKTKNMVEIKLKIYKMFRISGPHYVSIYTMNGCIVSIFGDIHFSKTDSCKDCVKTDECMNILDFYRKLKTPTDIFLEALYHDKKEATYEDNLKIYYKKLRQGQGFLREIVNYYKHHLYGKKHKHTKVHVHYGDIRSHSSLEYFYWIKHLLTGINIDDDDKKIGYALIESLKTKYHFKKLIDAMVKSNDFKKDIENIFDEIAWIYMDEEHLTTFAGHSPKIHRIRKQILKLKPKTQKAVLRYHEDASKDILKDFYCYNYTECRRKVLKKNLFEQGLDEDSLVIQTCIDKWLSHLMEIYTLSRMLFNIEQGRSKHITVYTGANHAYVFNHFFSKYMNNVFQHMWLYDSETEKSSAIRCVQIPVSIKELIMK